MTPRTYNQNGIVWQRLDRRESLFYTGNRSVLQNGTIIADESCRVRVLGPAQGEHCRSLSLLSTQGVTFVLGRNSNKQSSPLAPILEEITFCCPIRSVRSWARTKRS